MRTHTRHGIIFGIPGFTRSSGGTVPNSAPIIDLNGPGIGIDAAHTFTEGDEASYVIPPVLISDLDGTTLESVTIVGVSYGQDGANEQLEFGAAVFPSNVDSTQTVTVAGTTFQIAYTAATKTMVITRDGGGLMPIAATAILLGLLAYSNAATPPDTTPRTFSFVTNDGFDDSTAAVLTVTVVAAVETFFRLRESGDRQLRETGDYQLLEAEA